MDTGRFPLVHGLAAMFAGALGCTGVNGTDPSASLTRISPEERTSLQDRIVADSDGTEYYVTAYDGVRRPIVSLAADGPSDGTLPDHLANVIDETSPASAKTFFSPDRYMLDEQGLVSPAKNQGGRNSCTIFSAVGAIESAYLAQYGITLDLSEEYLINMINTDGPFTWVGGTPGWKLRVASFYGLPPETDWRYTSHESQLMALGRPAVPNAPTSDADLDALVRSNLFALDLFNYNQMVFPPFNVHQDAHYGPTEIGSVKADEAQIEQLLWQGHAISFMSATKSWKQDPTTGVFNYNGSTAGVDHAILIVGYDRINRIFRIKNSWGTGWNDHGFANFSYDLVLRGSGFSYPKTVRDPVVETSEPIFGAGAWRGFWRGTLYGNSGVAVIRHADGPNSTGAKGAPVGTFYGDDGSETPINSFVTGSANAAVFNVGAGTFSLVRLQDERIATMFGPANGWKPETWLRCNPALAGTYVDNQAPSTYRDVVSDSYIFPACN